jgi:uncharacterized protein
MEDMMTEKEFYELGHAFLRDVFFDLEEHKIKVEDQWELDHLCYRADRDEHYQALKKDFSQFAELLIETPVNGRMISAFKLHKPFYFKHWKIEVVELPAPKPGKVTSLGFEHVEVVCDVPFEKLIEQYSYLTLDLKGLSKAINPELEITLGKRNIKFHHSSLEEVVKLELEASK